MHFVDYYNMNIDGMLTEPRPSGSVAGLAIAILLDLRRSLTVAARLQAPLSLDLEKFISTIAGRKTFYITRALFLI